jgi:hypothetical protein
MLACIPKIKPHAVLKVTNSEAYMMVCFHILNDVFNSTKKKDGKYEANFTADVFSKLNNLGIDIQGEIALDIIKMVLPRCFKNMHHKGRIPKKVISIIKSIAQSFEA